MAATGTAAQSTDPTTGKTSTKTVTALHDNLDTDLTDVTITTGTTNAAIQPRPSTRSGTTRQ